MAKILVVEDDKNTNDVICDFLTDAGFDVVTVYDGEQALKQFSDTAIDLIILDIMLPKVDGLTVLKSVRQINKVPILMLTAMEDEHTQIMSFDRMADDYITNGVNAIAHTFSDVERPGKKDDVIFAVTRIDEKKNAAIGIITRIIKRNL